MSRSPHPTVLHALCESVEVNTRQLAVRLVEGGLEAVELTYAELYRLAASAARGLDELAVRKGDRIVLALPTCRELLAIYLGALFRGVVPIVVSRLGQEGRPSTQLESLWTAAQPRCVIVPDAALPGLAPPLRAVAAESLLGPEEAGELELAAKPGDIAHLQLTSGSTGRQKLAIVKHGNIVANIAGIGAALRLRPEDSLGMWLPLFHDMGLIAVSCSFYWQVPLNVTDTANFVRHPVRYWWQMMSRYGASITAAPNSAYHACARLAAARKFEGLDVSCCRVAFWGAEPIRRETLESFTAAFAPYGYRPEMTLPVYGLAEATLAATITEVDRPPIVDRPVQGLFAAGDGAAAPPSDFVCVGSAIAGHTVRVVDAAGKELEEGRVGEVEVAGPGVVDGYWGDPAPGALLRDGFLPTGDLGYWRDGRLYIVGRKKEILIIKGRNLIPGEIEAFVAQQINSDIARGVAAVGIEDPTLGTEALHILVESRVLPVPGGATIEETVHKALAESFGLTGATIHWVPKGGIPKTTSGKVQRFRCRELVRDRVPTGARASGGLR